MTAIAGTEESTAYLASAHDSMQASAARHAHTDARPHGVDHEAIAASAGAADEKTQFHTFRDGLSLIQRREDHRATSRTADASADVKRLRNPDSSTALLSSAPFRSKLPLRVLGVVVAAVLGAETRILIDPINEILAGGEGYTVTAIAAAATITLLTAAMAHARAEAIAASEVADPADHRARGSADADANLATVGVLAAAGTSVLARIYGAVATSNGIDAYGVAFFVLLQATFVLAAFVLPKLINDTRNRTCQQLRTKALARAEAELEAAGADEKTVQAVHAAQREQLQESAVTSVTTYLTEVTNNHPGTFSADYIRMHFDDIRSDAVRRLLDQPPLPRPDANEGPSTETPVIGPSPASAGPDSVDSVAPQADLGPAETEPQRQAHEWTGYRSTQELFDDLLGRAS